MLFRRRRQETVLERLRRWLWPTRSWRRSGRYVKKRILRLHATPHAIAAGFAAGVFAAFTPLLGVHFVIAFALAYCMAGNMGAAALGTFVGNPVTFPVIWAATYEAGRYLVHAELPGGEAPEGLTTALMRMDLAAVWTPYLKPMLIGSIPLGLLAALLSYLGVYLATRSFQHARARRLAGQAPDVRAKAGSLT